MESSVRQVASIYYNIKGFYSLTRKEPKISESFKLMPEFLFNKIPKFFSMYFNSVYQEIENGLFTYENFAFIVLFYYLIDEKLPVQKLADPKYIRSTLDEVFSKDILSKDINIINEVKSKEEKRGIDIFEVGFLGTSTFLDLYNEKLIGLSSVIINYEKLENKFKSYNKNNKKIIKTTKYLKELLKI